MKKQTRKLFCLFVSFVLLTTFLLVSCGDKDNDTSSDAVESGEPVSEQASEPVSATENQSSEESSEKPSEPEYQSEMTEEMAREFLKFQGTKDSFEELLASVAIKDYNYKDDYTAFGYLDGYTLCYVSPYFLGSTAPQAETSFIAGDYVFISPDEIGNPSKVCLYLYKDMSFITIEDAYEQGLFNPQEAYGLMQKNDLFKDRVKKLSDLSEEEAEMYRQNAQGYQSEMTEEMANAFLKLIGDNRTAQEYMTGIKWGEDEYMRAYAIYGNLNGYILCSMSNWVADTMMYTYTAGDYTFTSSHMWQPSYLGLYLYKDLTFITFEEAYENGLFDAKDAYELITAYSGPEYINPIEAKKSTD